MSCGTILLVEDDFNIRSLLKRILSLENYAVLEAPDLNTAYKMLTRENIEVIVCDALLPDGNGIDFTKDIKGSHTTSAEIIIFTAFATIEGGVQSIRNGAFDYIIKGDDNRKLLPLVANAMEKARLQNKVMRLEKQVRQKFGFENIIGQSSQILETIALARKLSEADTGVLLLGETGTGKELFARAIHVSGRRSHHPFVALNCSAISKHLLESEIFGHKAGAFTDAVKDRKGLMEIADGGTLFLDEIGEMDMELQAKFLRVLETNEFIKVGDTKSIKVDVRIIAATNTELEEDVKSGKFRKDLFFRLNAFTIDLPALRDRREDIVLIAAYYLDVFAKKSSFPVKAMSQKFMELLKCYSWPGNIRELKNVMERAVILATSPELPADSLPLEIQHPTSSPERRLEFNLNIIEKFHIQRALTYTHGRKARAAKLLGIGLTTLYRKIDEYKLHPEYPGA